MNIAALFDKASSAMTVVSFLTFVGIVWWVLRPANRKRWKADARMPLDDEHPQTPRRRED